MKQTHFDCEWPQTLKFMIKIFDNSKKNKISSLLHNHTGAQAKFQFDKKKVTYQTVQWVWNQTKWGDRCRNCEFGSMTIESREDSLSQQRFFEVVQTLTWGSVIFWSLDLVFKDEQEKNIPVLHHILVLRNSRVRKTPQISLTTAFPPQICVVGNRNQIWIARGFKF